MKTTKYGLILGVALSIGINTAACSSAAPDKPALVGAYSTPEIDTKGQTLANLQEAYNGETNASAKYLEYAKKADSEGYAGVAKLFRAASFAEGVHVRNHADVIRKMGGTPTAELKLPPIGSTSENLKEAIAGESYERDTMYADFMIEARRTGNKEALRTFNFAKVAEAEHAKLYSHALETLDQKNGENVRFFVCRTCGWTTSDVSRQKCLVDFTPREDFEVVN